MGYSLPTICTRLRGTSDALAPLKDFIPKVVEEQFWTLSRYIQDTCREWTAEFNPGDDLNVALTQFMELVRDAYELRLAKPLLECEFIARPIDREDYRGLVTSMLNACVVQGKPDRLASFRWEGRGNTMYDNTARTKLAVLQAALHFSQHHVKRNGGIFATKEIKSGPCPFIGWCDYTDKVGEEVCSTKPWDSFKYWRGDKLCLYAAGVAVMARQPLKSGPTEASV